MQYGPGREEQREHVRQLGVRHAYRDKARDPRYGVPMYAAPPEVLRWALELANAYASGYAEGCQLGERWMLTKTGWRRSTRRVLGPRDVAAADAGERAQA